jgi:DNA invertase Pin-like site-specific DNA recombinase
MSKISSGHLDRAAYVYVRQSTAAQVQHNHESQRRQYGLRERARLLGWQDVTIVDDDLGRSGSGVARPGFDRLLTAVGRGEVGAVFAIEASRLARNGRDWHTLLEFCAIVGALIIDEDGIYDPRSSDDQLMLGLKGTFSVMESSAIRQRAFQAKLEKAARGELFGLIAVGYVLGLDGRLAKDPNQRTRDSVGLVFSKFRELGSVRQVALWLRRENVCLPKLTTGGPRRSVEWMLPTYSGLLNMLANPVYAGAYAYGRNGRETTLEDGRRRVRNGVRLPREKWRVLLHDRHEGYIGWDEFERNLCMIANNTNRKGQAVQGAVRGGPALLAGLLRCGHCGRKLKVRYRADLPANQYYCVRPIEEDNAGKVCTIISGGHLDRAVSGALLQILAPLGIEAALAAIDSGQDRHRDQRRQAELALEAARYEAGLARRQYDAVDPDNRLVAGELERRWNDRLVTAQRLEAQVAAMVDDSSGQLSAAERARLMHLGRDLSAVWSDRASPIEIKKRITRTVIREIVVRVEDDRLHGMIHWHGGDHTALDVATRVRGRWREIKEANTEAETAALITALVRMMPDSSIAAVLNRLGKRTISGLSWTAGRVQLFRNDHHLLAYREGERHDRGELMLNEVVEELGVSKMTVIRMIHTKTLPARQVCPGAPYVILRQDLELPGVRSAPSRSPVSADIRQTSMLLQ